MTTKTEKPLLVRILPDILAFGIGLGIAYFLKWETTELVWSLWLCSLVLGYLTLLSAIGGGAYIGIQAIIHKDFKKQYRVPAVLIGIAIGIFFLGFFSLHFGAFHAVHSVFLMQFFPVKGMPDDGFGAAFMNPPLLWVLVFRHLMMPYGMFLIPAIIAERKHIFLPLVRAVKAVQAGMRPNDQVGDRTERKKDKDRHPIGDAMARPYLNVVRMHLLIFFFAFCHILKVDSFFVYAVVYFVYFFPWSEIKKRTA
ncbi:MAG: hypothetical protein HY343_00240 [Lentisphaerae bacterium]|nr:hypothetical protein [Lentisphaerota bacterium]